jgi:CBS domain-containing protein
MLTVKSILDDKGRDVWSVKPDTTILQALQWMAEKNVGAVLVIDQGKIAGIFSERDFARKAAEGRNLSLDTPVNALMTAPVYGVHPEQTLEVCMAIMTEGHFRHLPVVENNHLVGLISIGDVVKQIITEKQSTIDSLEDYIWINMI